MVTSAVGDVASSAGAATAGSCSWCRSCCTTVSSGDTAAAGAEVETVATGAWDSSAGDVKGTAGTATGGSCSWCCSCCVGVSSGGTAGSGALAETVAAGDWAGAGGAMTAGAAFAARGCEGGASIAAPASFPPWWLLPQFAEEKGAA